MNYPDSTNDSEKKEILFQNEISEKGQHPEFVDFYLKKSYKGEILNKKHLIFLNYSIEFKIEDCTYDYLKNVRI